MTTSRLGKGATLPERGAASDAPTLTGGISSWIENIGDAIRVRDILAPEANVLLLTGLIATHRCTRQGPAR